MQSTLAVISLRRIVKNALLVKKRAGVPLYAVVKDDGYGHGAERVSLALESYVDGFAVATVLEGEALRMAGVGKEVLVLTPCLSEREALSCFYGNLTPTASSLAALSLLERTAEKYAFPLRVQLAVNTGMNRYGFRPNRVEAICKRIKAFGAEVEGMFSHFYSPENKQAREEQFILFERASGEVKEYFPETKCHLSATGGILAGSKYNFDAVRCGIALYGYLPNGFEGSLPVRPAMKLYASSAQNLTFLGGGICYKKTEERYRKLSTFRLGYGDGFPRKSEIGNVHELCMDAFVREGYYPFGARKVIVSDVREYAERQGMIVYEALVNLTKKAEKVYV